MIQAENLAFSYTGSPPFVLDGIRFAVEDGDYVSILGDNGCGKSTLVKLILRFLRPTRGSIEVKTKRIGYVPQRSDAAASGFPITVHEMLDSYRRLLKLRDKSVIEESLNRVGLSGCSGALMGTLSGGQSQKALIARALMGDPELLILDEPSAGVDQDSQREIYGLIKALNAVRGITVVSVEHNLEAAVANSTLIYHLSGGSGHMCTPRQYVSEYLKPKGDEDHA
ncbi:metal ABC transporter ATP-binding protein [Papillibacter cinnamivorans]|uniref:Zinc transport system ATP-binding protein n=1 Tax=Papillibacter cinnamivorans DSM 12816 TaxID=1122930 RepID=A0A1W2AXZ5_9FIRM|nr:metal ABC transporter ATP-binding protein [Papillibacter cinnamivorans]SMC65617.1 zinc transport system ATP-binding protein [Papillibacter cinnamivorans DSM 12816]